MVDINSPLGRRVLATQAGQSGKRQVFTVPDESGAEPGYTEDEMMNQQMPEEVVNPIYRQRQAQQAQAKTSSQDISRESLEKMRQESRQAKLEVAPKAKNRIDFLLGLKKKTSEVEVEGVKFVLKTLKHAEYQDIFSSLSKMTDVNNLVISLEMQIQTLARSITHIDGIPTMVVLNVESIEDVIECLREFENDVIEQLHDEFKKLKSSVEVTKEEEREVTENLKK